MPKKNGQQTLPESGIFCKPFRGSPAFGYRGTMAVPGRDYTQLLRAMTELVAGLAREGGDEEALRGSFEAAARGFGAHKALLLRVEPAPGEARLRAIHAVGGVSREQLAACERGESVRGISPSVIRSVIESGRPALVEDPRRQADPAHTPSLAHGHYSVLCAPILDPLQGRPLAVAYFQNSGLLEAYGGDDLTWLEEYGKAAGLVFGFYLAQKRELAEAREREDAPEIVGDSAPVRRLRQKLHEVLIPAMEVERPRPILLLGERGTGKELIARYLHAYSSRHRQPLTVVNCAAISEELARSALFGHKRGSFTGAYQDSPGSFRRADGGVLFLDEVGELSLRVQADLLRAVENQTVEPEGESRSVPVDVAVILATNRDLDRAVRAGQFRDDFYDRIRTLTLRLPPLRERPGDILPLLYHYLRRHQKRYKKMTLGFTPEALQALAVYAWPGNVRDLSNACESFVLHAGPGAKIDRALVQEAFPEALQGDPNPRAAPLLGDDATFREAVGAFERELVLSRLEQHEGSVRAARESLGLTKTTFHRYLRRLGIGVPGETEGPE